MDTSSFIYSLIGSIVAIPLWQLLKWLGNYIITIAIGLSDPYSSVVYRHAAKALVENPIRQWLFLVPLFFVILFLILLFAADTRVALLDSELSRVAINIRQELARSTQQLEDFRSPARSLSPRDSTALDSSFRDAVDSNLLLWTTIDSLQMETDAIDSKLVIVFWLGSLIFLIILLIYSHRIYIIDLVSHFQLRLLRLEPHFSSNEIATLRSRWSLMKSKHDFDLLMTDLGNLDEIVDPHRRAKHT